jgi:anti-sigma factor (TIGR02949 family)
VSCGRPHETPCSEVLDRLYAFLDQELDDHAIRTIEVHLAECAPCLSEHDLEIAVKAVVARAGRSHAPEHLRAQILRSIHETKVVAE